MYGYGFRANNRLFGGGGGGAISTDFLMTIDTTKAGSASNTFVLRCGNLGVYNAIIDWGDGSTSEITTYNDADLTHVYSVGGTYQISISGVLPYILFENVGDKLKVLSIDNWGTNQWRNFKFSFWGCSNMDYLATDAPDLSLVQVPLGNLSYMFLSCSSITSIDITSWDTSTITNMALMFALNTSATLIDVTGIDTSNVTNLFQTFANGGVKNIVGLDTWDIEKVTSFSNFMAATTITTVEYDKLLIAWDGQDAVNSLAVNFGGSKYTLGSAAATARASLISTDLWTITDGGGI
jgi:surface protein